MTEKGETIMLQKPGFIGSKEPTPGKVKVY
jgi:hypothetical protein